LGDHGEKIQAAIDTVLANPQYTTLVFPAKGANRVYVTHDLHVTNHTGKHVELFFEEGVLLQRSGAHIGELTSPGFITLFNSTDVTLRGLATFDAFNGGQGLYVSSCENITVDGLIMRNTWWWNTEVEHSHGLTIRNYKVPNDPEFPFYQNDGVNLEHSTSVVLDRLFVASQTTCSASRRIQKMALNLREATHPTLVTSLCQI